MSYPLYKAIPYMRLPPVLGYPLYWATPYIGPLPTRALQTDGRTDEQTDTISDIVRLVG